jgi:hypothetical protein
MAPYAAKPDEYALRLIKYIPAEVVAIYLLLQALVRSAPDEQQVGLLWIAFAFAVLATPLYLLRAQNVRKPLQLGLSTIAFVVWVLGMGGGPFRDVPPIVGSMVLTMYTFLIPLIEP